MVLDALVGGGRHRVRSSLHLHPDAGAVLAEPFGARAARARAPLHERWGETREMWEHFVEAEAPLPWLGGWLVLPPGEARPPVEADLAREDAWLVARCRVAALELEIRWDFAGAPRPASVRLARRPGPA